MIAENISTPKVLVVDDHPDNLVAMRHILANSGSEVVCVESGNEALKQLIRDEFAVVLMDVQMPGMNGFETASIIRENAETKNLPIIFVTAISKEKQYVQQGYELGAVDYLFKPFDPYILRYKVSVFMELYRQRTSFLELAKKNQLILDSVKDGVLGLDANGIIVFCNPAAARMLNADRSTLQGEKVIKFIKDHQDADWNDNDISKTCRSGRNFSRADMHFESASGDVFPVECTVSVMQSLSEEMPGFVLVFTDISERIKSQQQLAHLAEYDSLTGLANRRLFYKMLPSMISRAKRFNHKIALLFVDIDNFKSINDTLGHVVGDLLLSQVAERLKQSIRESDSVVRLSGDEFIVILEGELSTEDISLVAKKLINEMGKPFQLNHQIVHSSVSVGIAVAPDVSSDPNELVKAADVAMYNAKSSGRNRYQFYDKELNQKVSFRSKVETQILPAIENNEFFLAYQPKINIDDKSLKGFEALIRWDSPELGSISPATFIPISEDCGRINEIGNWVLMQACQQLKAWKSKGLFEEGFSLSVNFSIKQLNDPRFLMKLEKIIKELDIDPVYLDIEITESTLMSNPNVVVPLLRILSEMGMTISVDDFGTGYSSLNYLKVLPLDYLKIDQSFIKDLFVENNSEIITRSIINLAHNLDLKVVAEGIETVEQEEFLSHHGCDIGQGYLYGKAQVPSDAQSFFQTVQY